MKKPIKQTICILSVITMIAMMIPPASAYNYTPGVEVNDEVIWVVERNNYNSSHQEIKKWYYKLNITDIVDNGTDTIIQAWEGESTVLSGLDSDSDVINNITVLTDYQNSPLDLIETHFLPAGAKIGNYSNLLQAELPNAIVTSLNDGWGIKIEEDDETTTYQYNEVGIFESYFYHLESTETSKNVSSALYSINGDLYTPKDDNPDSDSIPGYNMLTLFIGLGIMTVSVINRMRKRIHIEE